MAYRNDSLLTSAQQDTRHLLHPWA
ncbi:hypothetical protein BP354A_3647, partial [Burkholderia pseudomallei 354a]